MTLLDFCVSALTAMGVIQLVLSFLGKRNGDASLEEVLLAESRICNLLAAILKAQETGTVAESVDSEAVKSATERMFKAVDKLIDKDRENHPEQDPGVLHAIAKNLQGLRIQLSQSADEAKVPLVRPPEAAMFSSEDFPVPSLIVPGEGPV